eukprot:7215340-Pyramimonas_sp.AAC.1
MEIVKYAKLNWKIHTKLRSLLHVADHVPMIMQIKMPVSGANITNNSIRWDFGLLAAGLQTGAHRASFLTDVSAEIDKSTGVLRAAKMDQFPTRHNALIAHSTRECGRKYYTKEGGQPQ